MSEEPSARDVQARICGQPPRSTRPTLPADRDELDSRAYPWPISCRRCVARRRRWHPSRSGRWDHAGSPFAQWTLSPAGWQGPPGRTRAAGPLRPSTRPRTDPMNPRRDRLPKSNSIIALPLRSGPRRQFGHARSRSRGHFSHDRSSCYLSIPHLATKRPGPCCLAGPNEGPLYSDEHARFSGDVPAHAPRLQCFKNISMSTKTSTKVERPPGPRQHWLFGNLREFSPRPPGRTTRWHRAVRRPRSGSDSGPGRILFLNHPDLVEDVLVDKNRHFTNISPFDARPRLATDC